MAIPPFCLHGDCDFWQSMARLHVDTSGHEDDAFTAAYGWCRTLRMSWGLACASSVLLLSCKGPRCMDLVRPAWEALECSRFPAVLSTRESQRVTHGETCSTQGTADAAV